MLDKGQESGQSSLFQELQEDDITARLSDGRTTNKMLEGAGNCGLSTLLDIFNLNWKACQVPQ